MKHGNDLLFELWEHIELDNVKPSVEETKILKLMEECEMKLLSSLSGDEKVLFDSFCNSLYELNLLSKKFAFTQGIRFATKYLLESLED